MNLRRYTFVQTIRFLLSAALILLTIAVIISQVIKSQHQANRAAEESRADYVEKTRTLIKHEVEHVARTLDCRSILIENRTHEEVKQRVTEAHAIATFIYQQNIQTKSKTEIQKMIIDALRPIRFSGGTGYFFITQFNGIEVLFSDKPELEGTNMINVKGGRGKLVVKDLLNIAKTKSEGHYEYHWTKPGKKGKEHKKVSYIKAFEPYQWAIGTGLYIEDAGAQLQNEIVEFVNGYRFGQNGQGYVFVLELLNIHGGDEFAVMYANPNRPDLIGKYISDSFTDARGKTFRQEMLRGIRKNGDCYVDYWYEKLDNPQPCPKTSYFKLSGDGNFIVAAGVYLDDTEADVLAIREEIFHNMRSEIRNTVIAALLLFVIFWIIFHSVTRRLLGDFTQLFTIFKHAAQDEKTIDRSKIKFKELYEIAGDANTMLRDKISAQKAVIEEKNQLAVTLRSIADAVIAVDPDGRITLMNHNAENLCGWQETDAVGKEISDVLNIFKEKDQEETENPASAVLNSGQVIVSEKNYTLQAKDGTRYSIETSAAPIRANTGNLQGAVLVFRDITSQLRKDQEVFRSRKLESVGILAGGIAHDFNNHLTSLFGNIQLARMELQPDHNSTEYLRHAEESMENATNLTKQLLTFARGGSPVKSTLSIAQTVTEAAQFSLRGSNVRLSLNLDDDLFTVEGDKGQLNQVISNLVINAQQAMPEGGTITITAHNRENMVYITIGDEGVGISPRHISKIFDPYFTTKNRGSGLGLATSHSIIEKHNGSITVESKQDDGSTFTICLPASVASSLSMTNGVENTKKVKIMNQAKILILDDEASVRRVMGKMLEQLGHAVSFSATGSEALEMYQDQLAKNTPFDLVVTDLTIPGGMGGQKTAEEILKLNPEAKIIVASGYATDHVLSNFKDFGFKGRVVKPYMFKELETAVSAVLKS